MHLIHTALTTISLVQFVGNVVDIVGGLQDWPEDALQTDNNGAQ